jgi:hypothetical protein
MFFDRFVARLLPHSSKKGQTKVSQTRQTAASPNKAALLQFSKNLNSIKELNIALEEIDQAIEGKSATNQQLLLKAEILLRKGKFRKAKEVLTSTSKNRKDQKSANTSKCLLKILPQLQQESTKQGVTKLVKDLHDIANKYKSELQSLPPVDELPPNLDITLLIRREGTKARSAELPGLSLELINRTLQDEQKSLWLLHDKALSLNMMGQQQTAQQILEDLKKSTKKEKLTNSINKNIADIKKNQKHYKSKLNLYLAKQLRSTSAPNNFDTNFLPEEKEITPQTKIKLLAFRKGRAILTKNPKGCLHIASSILDYCQGDLAALLLQGEALAALKRNDLAINILKRPARSQEETIAKRASELISQILSKESKQISTKESPKAALIFFIQQHLTHGVPPTITADIKKILQQLEPSETNFSDPELEHHHLQLLFNTQLVECLEARFRERGRLSTSSPAQNPAAIGKTAPKAG